MHVALPGSLRVDAIVPAIWNMSARADIPHHEAGRRYRLDVDCGDVAVDSVGFPAAGARTSRCELLPLDCLEASSIPRWSSSVLFSLHGRQRRWVTNEAATKRGVSRALGLAGDQLPPGLFPSESAQRQTCCRFLSQLRSSVGRRRFPLVPPQGDGTVQS